MKGDVEMFLKRMICSVLFLCMVLTLGVSTASAEKTFNWRLASVWSEGAPNLESERLFARMVDSMSNGRLKIKVFPEGQLGPANQVLDLVSRGAIEAGGEWASFWAGKNTAFDLLGTQVMGFSPMDYYIWIYAFGGKKFYDDLFAQVNCVYFPHHAHDLESGFRSNKEIKTLEDFKGMKIRVGGLIQGKLLQALGAQPVAMSGSEVYEALQRGVIDACEFSTPEMDLAMKLNEVTKFWLTPGFHQTSTINGIIINKKNWDELPDDLKAIVENASKACYVSRFASSTLNSAKATNEILAMGVKINRLSNEDLLIIEREKNKLMETLAAENPEYAAVLKSQIEFDKTIAPYRNQLEPWGFGKAWGSYPDLK